MPHIPQKRRSAREPIDAPVFAVGQHVEQASRRLDAKRDKHVVRSNGPV